MFYERLAGFSFLSYFFVLAMVPKTKSRTLEEIVPFGGAEGARPALRRRPPGAAWFRAQERRHALS